MPIPYTVIGQDNSVSKSVIYRGAYLNGVQLADICRDVRRVDALLNGCGLLVDMGCAADSGAEEQKGARTERVHVRSDADRHSNVWV